MQKEIDRIIWDNAWRLAQAKGWDRNTFASKIGVARSTIDSYANGNRGISKKALTHIAAALHLTESDLMLEKGVDSRRAEEDRIGQCKLIPEIIKKIYEGDNKALKDVLTKYAVSLMARYNAIKSETELLSSITGTESEIKQLDQGNTSSIDETPVED